MTTLQFRKPEDIFECVVVRYKDLPKIAMNRKLDPQLRTIKRIVEGIEKGIQNVRIDRVKFPLNNIPKLLVKKFTFFQCPVRHMSQGSISIPNIFILENLT